MAPCVTTRDTETGQGLAIVKRIIEDHMGSLKLEQSNSGDGAQVMIVLPRFFKTDSNIQNDPVNSTSEVS